MTVLSDVETALPDEFIRVDALCKKMGLWEPEKVERCLNQLCALKKAEQKRIGFIPHIDAFIYLYRRARNTHREAA